MIPGKDGQFIKSRNQIPPGGNVAGYEYAKGQDGERVHEAALLPSHGRIAESSVHWRGADRTRHRLQKRGASTRLLRGQLQRSVNVFLSGIEDVGTRRAMSRMQESNQQVEKTSDMARILQQLNSNGI